MSRSMSNFLWILGNLILLTVGFAVSGMERFYLALSVIGGAQLLLALYINVKNTKSFFKPLIIYEVVMYLFLFGQCLMWIVTEDYSGINIIDIYNKDLIERGEIFTLVSMFFFHIALFSTRGRTIKIASPSRTAQLREAMYLSGILLLFITTIPEIVFNIRIFRIAQAYGYLGIYDIQASSLMQKFLNLREFFFPATILVLCGDTRDNKLLRNALVGAILLDVSVGLYVGSRSDALMQIVSLALVLQMVKPNQAKLKKREAIKYVLLFVVIIMAANVVGAIRVMPNRDISTFFEYLFEANTAEGSDNMVIAIMGELGGTMRTLLETMLLVPSDFNHLYGSSYLYALTWLIPGFLTNNIWLKASMNNWIDTVRYTGSGWGFSTTAEAYFNFGYAGVLVFLIVGFAVGKLFKGLGRDLFEKNPVEFALSFILFNRLLIFSRIDFLSSVPTVVYFYFGIKIFIHLIDYASRVKGR